MNVPVFLQHWNEPNDFFHSHFLFLLIFGLKRTRTLLIFVVTRYHAQSKYASYNNLERR